MAGKVPFSKLYREGVKSGGIKVKYEIQTQDRINFLCDAVFLLKRQEASTVRLRLLGVLILYLAVLSCARGLYGQSLKFWLLLHIFLLPALALR